MISKHQDSFNDDIEQVGAWLSDDTYQEPEAYIAGRRVTIHAWYRGAALVCGIILSGLFVLKVAFIFGGFLPAGYGEWWGIHEFSDFLSMLGGRHFAEEGFFRHFLLMNTTVGPHEIARGWQYFQVPQLVHNSAVYYTHYGSLDALIVGLLFLGGITSLQALYVLFALLSFLCLAFWVYAARLLFGYLCAIVSVVLIAPSVFFFTVAESPTAESLSWDITFVAIGLFAIAECRPISALAKRWLYVGVWVCCFLQANNNPQFIPLMAMFIATYALLYWKRSPASLGRCVVLLSGLPAGILVHMLLAIFALGGWDNFWTDLVAALARRTQGFAQAVELPFREFDIRAAPATLLRFLLAWQALSPWRWPILVLAAPVFLLIAGPDDRARRMREWALAMALLLGGIVFISIFPQATVTQPLDILKTLLPGTAVLLGLTAREAIVVLRRCNAFVSLPAALLAVMTVGPVMLFNLSGSTIFRGFGAVLSRGAAIDYLGAAPEEIRRVTDFISAHTRYGDVVFAGFLTGDTSHPDYPNPAWEYLANRQIRVFDSPAVWAADKAKLLAEINRQSSNDSVLKQVRVFAMIADDASIAPSMVDFLRGAKLMGRLDVDGSIPLSNAYSLYLLPSEDRGDKRDVPQAELPGQATPWTNILTSRTRITRLSPLQMEGGWRFSRLPSVSLLHKDKPALLHVHSARSYQTKLTAPDVMLHDQIGSTIEVRFMVDHMLRRDPNSALITLGDGVSELKATFSGAVLTLNDQDLPIGNFPLPAVTEFATLRLAVVDGRGYAYLNGVPLMEGTKLQASSMMPRIAVGDFSEREGEIIEPGAFDIAYVAYSNMGAFSPDGRNLSDMQPAIDSGTPWTQSETRSFTADWVARNAAGMVLASAWKSAPSYAYRTLPELDNNVGSTFEVRAKIEGGTVQDPKGAIMALRDGRRDLAISFFQDRVAVYDGGTEIARLPAATSRVESYRLAVVRDCGYVFFGDRLAFSHPLRSSTTEKGVTFGDTLDTGQRNFMARLGHISVSSKGAYRPGGAIIGGESSERCDAR